MTDEAVRYRVLLADPPWRFADRLPGPGRGAEKHYRCLPVEELCVFPLPPLADDCTLFLWRVASMQQEALDVMAAWGFTLKTEIVWVKRTRTGRRWFGMGRTVRAEHEVCLVGTRGRPVTRTKNIRSTFAAFAGKHSEKPVEFYDIVEALREGPYVELFARRCHPGWTSLGNQVPVNQDGMSVIPCAHRLGFRREGDAHSATAEKSTCGRARSARRTGDLRRQTCGGPLERDEGRTAQDT